MDLLDRKIIDLLARDARTPYARIAGETGVATATVHQRVKRLRNEGVIKGYTLDLDWVAVGLPVSAIVSITTRSRRPLADLAGELRRMDYVTGCASVTGEFDLSVRVRAASPDHLGRIIDEIRSVADGSTVTALMLTSFFDGETPSVRSPETGAVDDAVQGRRSAR